MLAGVADAEEAGQKGSWAAAGRAVVRADWHNEETWPHSHLLVGEAADVMLLGLESRVTMLLEDAYLPWVEEGQSSLVQVDRSLPEGEGYHPWPRYQQRDYLGRAS